jgi:UDP-N-acetylglucosamine 2-epimerase (non-hydrolysing)
LGIPEPHTNLGVGSGSHAQQTAQVLSQIGAVFAREKPDAVVVVGDVNSTLAATLAAVKLQIPVAHVEAGLRSGDRSMPEEINRMMTDVVSTWLFTTEADATQNLRREGVPDSRIHEVGSVMIDTLLANLKRSQELDTLRRFGLEAGCYSLLTLHRQGNVDEPDRLRRLFKALEAIHTRIPVVFPVHPRTRVAISKFCGQDPYLTLIEPQGYLDFLRLMADAKFVLTDSGGVQDETTALGVTCLTLRDNTERPVTVSEGTNLVVGSDPATILAEAGKIIDGLGKSGRRPLLWDGKTAGRIVDVLERDLGAESR